MDSQLADVLASGRTGLLISSHLPETEHQPEEPKPLAEVQVHPMDLSLKPPDALLPRSQNLCLKQSDCFHKEINKPNCGEGMVQSSVLEQGEVSTGHTALDLAGEKSRASDPAPLGADTAASFAKDLLQSAHSPVTVKEEIEEVCIGDMDSHWQAPYSLAFSNDVKTEVKVSEDAANRSGMMPRNTFATIKSDHEDILVGNLEVLTKDEAEQKPYVAETQTLGLSESSKGMKMAVRSQSKLTQDKDFASSRNGLCDTMQSRHEEGNEEKWKGETGFQVVPSVSNQELCTVKKEYDKADVHRIEKEDGVKQKMEGEGEALNLCLSKKARHIETIKVDHSEQNEIESTLVMEVDEIVQREDEEDEDHEDEDDSQTTLEQEFPVVNVVGWDAGLSPPCISQHHSPSFSSPEDPSVDGLLLIDDQGIPYILTPDGEKVLQVTPSKPCKFSSVNRSRVKQEESNHCPSSPVGDLPKQGTCADTKDTPPHIVCAVSKESSTASKIIPPLYPKSAGHTAVITPSSKSSSLSNVASQPVQILANPTSNFLLVPSSHLSSSPTSKPKSNSGLLTLSLPISLNPNPPAAPLFLVLSPLTTASATPSSSSSAGSIMDPIPTSSIPSSISQSASSAPLDHATSPAVTGSSSSSSSSSPISALNYRTTSTSVLGNRGGPTPNTSSISSGSTKNTKTELTSKAKVHTSPVDKAPKCYSPSNLEKTSTVENLRERTPSPDPTVSSPVQSTQSVSPPCTPPSVMIGSKDPSPVSEPMSSSETLVDSFSSDKSHYTPSDTPPPTTIFPTNHPKNFSLTSSCPRRILYCQFCPRAFYYLSDLERHSITHSKSKPHVCPVCNKAFKRSSHLERHKHIHTGQRNFICQICSKRFREAGELLRHQRVHTGEKPFQCTLCHMRFAERNTLRRHTKRKHQELNGHGDGDGMHGAQESAEWYSSVPDMDSDIEAEKE